MKSLLIVTLLLAGCSSSDELSYKVKVGHVSVEGKSKTDAATAKAAAAINEMVIREKEKQVK